MEAPFKCYAVTCMGVDELRFNPYSNGFLGIADFAEWGYCIAFQSFF